MKNLLIYFLLAVMITACTSCEKDATLPTVTTTQISAITINSVTSGGMIKDDGNARILGCGVCYSLSPNPVITGERTNDYIIENSFTSHINGLEPGKTYYLRAYATNEVGTNYGETISFNTSGNAPAATTLDASDVVFNCAILNGTLNTDGIETKATFIYGIDQNNLNESVEVNSPAKGTPTLTVNASVSNLEDNTTYYFALKAANSLGTVIGETKSFKTLEGHLSDIDGNVYKLVKIGDQIWMAENLKVTHYNDGSVIPNVTDNDAWLNLTTGGYCDYNNDPNNSTIYGRLYNCYTVWTGKLAPAGWHVPTNNDWDKLFIYVNGNAGELRETGYAHWWSPNIGATNSTGFNALPNGGRYNHYVSPGQYANIGENATWWASDKDPDHEIGAYEKFLSYQTLHIYDNWIQVADEGYGVRLIKD